MATRNRPARPPRRKPVSRKAVAQTPVWVLPAAVVAGLAVIVAAFLVIRWYTTPLPPTPLAPDSTQVVVTSITTLPASEFDAVGQGSANNLIKPVSGALLTGAGGKPEVFYLGAEYCPYCAAERWPVIIALSRFGTFSGLATTSSSSTDVYPNTPTFTFRNATYSSQYVDFVSVETSDRNQSPLQSPTAAEQDLVSRYDTADTIPFVDFGNRFAFSGAMYVPNVVDGMSWQAVADALHQPGSPQSKAILGSANLITAAVCKMTGDQPAAVCSSSTIQALEHKLG
jgi:thiol-disulfide isomerase/thioredoxin